jgi:uncharacterized protein (TIGR02246 family)
MPARTPEEVVRLFEKHMNAGDIDAVVALYEPTGALVPPGDDAAIGHDAIRAGVQPFLDAKAELHLNVVKTVVAGDIAVTYDDWTATMDGPDGGRVNLQGRAIEVERRQPDGTWLFVYDDATGRD